MRRNSQMWMGTQHHAQWVRNPLAGANMSPEGWGAEGTFLSGGGYVKQSRDSHRQYIFEYSGASSRQDAEIMQAYRDGVYSLTSRDLIYFHDPLTYSRNVLPKRWAQPGLNVPEITETLSPLGIVSAAMSPLTHDLPLKGAHVVSPIATSADFNAISAPEQGVLYVPIPEGKSLMIRVWGNTDLHNGVFFREQNQNGTWSAPNVIIAADEISGAKGVLLGMVGEFDLFGMRAVLSDSFEGDVWLPGSGHSGCRFVGNPTWVGNSGVNGGQIGYAATLKEVGDWEHTGTPSRPATLRTQLEFVPSVRFPGALTVMGPPGYMSSPGLLSVPIGE